MAITKEQLAQANASLAGIKATLAKLSGGFSEMKSDAERLGIQYDPRTTQLSDLEKQITAAKQTGGELSLPPTDEEYTLPTADISNLSSDQTLAFALRDVAKLAQREGKITGTAAASTFFANRGIMPEDLPGSSIANMLAVVDRAMVDPVADRATALSDLLDANTAAREKLRETSMAELQMLINTNGLAELDDATIYGLAGETGINQKYLMGVKKAMQEELAAPKSFSVQEIDGKLKRFGFNADGAIVSETELGDISDDDTTPTFNATQYSQFAALGVANYEADAISKMFLKGMGLSAIKNRIAYDGIKNKETPERIKRLQQIAEYVAVMLASGEIEMVFDSETGKLIPKL